FIFDINNFNTYNKLNGFLYGNKILKATSELLRDFINKQENYSIYKLSIDRFAIISKNYDEISIEMFCKNLFNYFDTLTLKIDMIDNFVNFCIGVTKIDGYEKSIIEAEYALDYAKNQGSGNYIIYDKNSQFVQEEHESISSLKNIRTLILDNKIIPFFQPIVDIETQQIVKYEVLARIRDNDTIIPPNKFLNSANRLGMLGHVTKSIIIDSFKSFANSDIHFSINLTQRDVLDDTMVDFINAQASKYSINLSNVTFEILENLTLSNDDIKIRDMITMLKKSGSLIAIDDFGSENSNFSRLLSLQSDFIKIDGMFIQNCDKQTEKQTIIKAIVELAKALDMKTVAEFVSSKEIYDMVKTLGVDYAQGYYFGKPEERF
ncbi:MAG: EAL domain-containing protein, partial [Campylobacterales bacterium]|nr:EAL domain-containing protein [Campylobacterales bacterium]